MACLLNPIRYVFVSCFFLNFILPTWAQIDTLTAKIEVRSWLEDKKEWINFTDVYPVIHQSQLLYVSTQTQEVIRMHFEGCQAEMTLRLTRRDFESMATYESGIIKTHYSPKEIHVFLDLSQVKSMYLNPAHPQDSFLYNGEFVQYLKEVYILCFFELEGNLEKEKQLLIGSHVNPALDSEPASRIKEAFYHYIQLCGGYVARKE